MPIDLRPLTPADQPLIWDFLYLAIYVSERENQPSRTVLEDPKIAVYAADWGCVGDMGFMAIENKTPVGAAWLRLIHGYGHVADDIPELTMAVLPGYRGKGIGTALLSALIDAAARSYPGISLRAYP
jgi:GNAT superfamily N-acetyltransferase